MNQVGFLPSDVKTAVILSKEDLAPVVFQVRYAETGAVALEGQTRSTDSRYGNFADAHIADFSKLKKEGTYVLEINSARTPHFRIHKQAYRQYLEYPMFYLLQQHCGYNAVFDTVCHQQDAVAVDGPDSGKRVNTVGGYHDASDYLRFLITTSYTTGILLLTYKDYSRLWKDERNLEGRRIRNGVPDVLDEARWGLEWMKKLNPQKGKLYHQVADDRDHAFWDLPYRDSSDYGWGRAKGRPAYFATGSPQGLFTYKNESSGISNVAARTAAVFALGSWIWKNIKDGTTFSDDLLLRAIDLYEDGKKNLGASESVPCKAPYRFHEKTFYDDLEWAAAELYRATGDKKYLDEAVNFASLAADVSWMGLDTTKHYEYFPYVNPGHYELFEFVDDDMKKNLSNFYRESLMRASQKAQLNAFNYGVPFVWVSNNLATGLVTQAMWYKKMSRSEEFDDLLFAARDWLFGRNPWGQSFAIGIPETGNYPTDPHSVVTKELGIRLTGALVDGPVYASIFANLRGLRLLKEDRFAAFQSSVCLYHDDLGDYSTNEPTIDGTASMLYILAHFSSGR